MQMKEQKILILCVFKQSSQPTMQNNKLTTANDK